ncbi:MAG: ABC transporter permease [Bacteroidales bacterium]|nr:ABC transporter permease [Bacteroidales bacterium]
MNKIPLIIKREFLTRVRKKSFILMSFLGPVIFAMIMIMPAWLMHMEEKGEKTIAVIEYNQETNRPVPDSLQLFRDLLPESDILHFEYLDNISLEQMKTLFPKTDYYAVLFIPGNIFSSNTVKLYATKQPSLSISGQIEHGLEKIMQDYKLIKKHIPVDIINSVKTDINVSTIKWTNTGEEKESHHEVAVAVGYISGFLIYMFIFIFGSMVMRGVIEEKTNRIVELMASSVKPFQIMTGKIIGIALVALAQFALWVLLTGTFVTVAKTTLFPELTMNPTEKVITQDLMQSQSQAPTIENTKTDDDYAKFEDAFAYLEDINWTVMLLTFLFYFMFGYLLYAALFAAVGSAIDSDTDIQQFMLPVTIPLIMAMFAMLSAINNPEGPVAFWFSMIPFTSPIVMMVRIPFNVSGWQIAISMSLLIFTFLGTVWMAGKIYRTGILMYGKKPSFKEMFKWLRYKN